jgi:hypothetical protein
MKTKREKLQELIDNKNPFNKITMLRGEQGIQGEPGYTPVVGLDYYTEEEKTAIINYIQSNVKHGEKGDKGDKGDSIKGDTGYSPKRGLDFWTDKDQEKIIRDVLTKIPKPKDCKDINVDEVIQAVTSKIPQVNYKDEIGKILNTPGMRMLLHGGGITTELDPLSLHLTGGTMLGAEIAFDHGTETNPEVVNIVYGTGLPPIANTTTIGTLFIKYIS